MALGLVLARGQVVACRAWFTAAAMQRQNSYHPGE